VSKSIDDLRSDVRDAAREALKDMLLANLTVIVTSTLRSVHHQVALYAQGRSPLETVNHLRMMADLGLISEKENKYTVTNADGVTHKSAHQDGRAFDIVLVKNNKAIWRVENALTEYKTLGTILKSRGFVWGGDWKPINKTTGLGFDPFHAEFAQ
jgi:hypothetical protein